MRRVANWDREVLRKADELRGKDFEWGETDCATVAGLVADAMYPEPLLNVHISSLRDARDVVGGPGPVGVLEAAGAKEIHPGLATCGDILVGEGDPDGLPSLYVVLRGHRVIGSRRDSGVVFGRMDTVGDVKAYRLPA